MLLSPIASHQIIIFMPLFEADYPANARIFCDLLLEVASFDIIPLEEINASVWGEVDSYSQDAEEGDSLMAKIESLGYDGTWLLLNIGSTLIYFGLHTICLVTLVLASSIKHKCCHCLHKRQSSIQGMLFWTWPIQFVNDAYSVLALCTCLNVRYLDFSDGASALNSLLSLITLGLLVLYPLFIQNFLY